MGENYEMSPLVQGREFGVQGSLVIVFPFLFISFDQNELGERCLSAPHILQAQSYHRWLPGSMGTNLGSPIYKRSHCRHIWVLVTNLYKIALKMLILYLLFCFVLSMILLIFQRKREKEIDCMPSPGIEPTGWAYALTKNQTNNLLVAWMDAQPLSHTSKACLNNILG